MHVVTEIESAQLAFNQSNLALLQGIIATIMLGVALDLRVADFAKIRRYPRPVAVGLATQLFALPVLTIALARLLDPPPFVALGMCLLAACPGGNVSNYLTHLAKGQTEVSVVMTSIVSLAATFTTPLIFGLCGMAIPSTAALLREIALEPGQMVQSIAVMLLLPLVSGIGLRERRPSLADKLRKPLQLFSGLAFAVFIFGALWTNRAPFMDHIGQIFALVLVHNALAFALGYSAGALGGVGEAARRALTFEVGIQNTAIGLALVFTFFDGNGGMAIILAWWGVWHLISGGALAMWWRRRAPSTAPAGQSAIPARPA